MERIYIILLPLSLLLLYGAYVLGQRGSALKEDRDEIKREEKEEQEEDSLLQKRPVIKRKEREKRVDGFSLMEKDSLHQSLDLRSIRAKTEIRAVAKKRGEKRE